MLNVEPLRRSSKRCIADHQARRESRGSFDVVVFCPLLSPSIIILGSRREKGRERPPSFLPLLSSKCSSLITIRSVGGEVRTHTHIQMGHPSCHPLSPRPLLYGRTYNPPLSPRPHKCALHRTDIHRITRGSFSFGGGGAHTEECCIKRVQQ